MKKKFLSGLMALAMAIPCAFGLVGCGEDPVDPPATPAPATPAMTFTVADNVLSNANAIVTDIKTNIYNNDTVYGTGTTYTVEQVVEKDSDFVYYVEVGTVANAETVETVEFNGVAFEDDDKFTFSVGKSNYIEDEVFYVNDNKIYVAAPVITYECVNNSKIKINNTEFDFDLEVTAQLKNWSKVEFETGSTNTVEASGTEYNLNFNDGTTFLKFCYDGAELGDTIVTRRNNTTTGKVSYGFSTAEQSGEDVCLALYPIGWIEAAQFAEKATAFDGYVVKYDVYVVGKGVIKSTLNYNVDQSV